MTRPPLALQAPDDAPLELASVVSALGAKFTVTTGARQMVRRTLLDTFDRRLRAADLTLEHESAGAGEQLVLRRDTGGPEVARTVVAPSSSLRWPALAASLPASPVRDAVAPVSGIRALMVARDEKRRVRRLELRNDDGKTVARVELDEPAAASGSPAEVVVRTLRGYDDQARRAAKLLAGLGLRPVDGARGDDAAGAADAADADNTDNTDDTDAAATGGAPPTPAVSADAPASALLASALGQFLEAIQVNIPGVLDDVDTEFLHDLRVAVRRTRSTLKLGRPVLPDDFRTAWEPAFKYVGDLTTPVRDLDVYELDLPTMAGWLVATDTTDLQPFATHLRRRRTVERRALLRGLRSAKFQRLLTGWEQALAELAESAQPEETTAGRLGQRSIAKAYGRVARDGAAISTASPAEDLHSLRKRCKELRYALEVFSPVLDSAARKQAVTDLKGLQDVLGRFQDSEVQRQALRDFAEEMMADGTSAGAVLAMGELIGHLDAEQERARRDFDSAFARFVRPASHRRLQKLGGAR